VRLGPVIATLAIVLLGRPCPAPAEPLNRRPNVVVVPALPTPVPVPTSCWIQPRYFESLKTGVFEYCRGHLRYQPGKLDCYYFAEEVCWVFLPGNEEWTQTHNVGPSTRFPCPDGPEPPVCPRLAGH
jgi:hypothetical protein